MIKYEDEMYTIEVTPEWDLVRITDREYTSRNLAMTVEEAMDLSLLLLKAINDTLVEKLNNIGR